MKTIKGPAIYLAQFLGVDPPFDNLAHLAQWAAGLGFKGIQVPVTAQLIDLEQAAASQTYCDDWLGVAADAGVSVTELATHLQGQLVAVHPAYDLLFDGFAAPHVRGNPQARTEWAIAQLKLAFFQPLYLDNIRARRFLQRRDRGVEVAVLLKQARKLRPKLAFFLLRHRSLDRA